MLMEKTLEDKQDNMKAAVKQSKNNPKLKHLSRFHHLSVSHRALKEEKAERYYEYLLRIRTFLHEEYAINVLANLEQLPLETEESLIEYYEKINVC